MGAGDSSPGRPGSGFRAACPPISRGRWGRKGSSRALPGAWRDGWIGGPRGIADGQGSSGRSCQLKRPEDSPEPVPCRALGQFLLLTLAHFGRRILGARGSAARPSASAWAREGRRGSSRSWLSFKKAAAFRLASLLGAGSPSRRAPSSGAGSGDWSRLPSPRSPSRGRFLEKDQVPVARSRLR